MDLRRYTSESGKRSEPRALYVPFRTILTSRHSGDVYYTISHGGPSETCPQEITYDQEPVHSLRTSSLRSDTTLTTVALEIKVRDRNMPA
jgi:hypothetical protein